MLSLSPVSMRWSNVSSSAASPVTAKYRRSTTSLYSVCSRDRKSWNSAICVLSFIFSDDAIAVRVRSWLEPGPFPGSFDASALVASRFSRRSLHSRASRDVCSIMALMSSRICFMRSLRVTLLLSSCFAFSFTSARRICSRMPFTVVTSAKKASMETSSPAPEAGGGGFSTSDADAGAAPLPAPSFFFDALVSFFCAAPAAAPPPSVPEGSSCGVGGAGAGGGGSAFNTPTFFFLKHGAIGRDGATTTRDVGDATRRGGRRRARGPS
eukprot:31163-Pelagococcus_subviridis.AAC.3